MRGGCRDQVGEAFEGDGIAIIQILGDGLFERQELDHRVDSRSKKFALRTYVLYAKLITLSEAMESILATMPFTGDEIGR
ncbi:hypothetical protein GCM10007881_52460 [Mesorhizobium huakuii]|nr:hypothetical protein GCM10007881_52460 [Mesorhizobium huakuii]